MQVKTMGEGYCKGKQKNHIYRSTTTLSFPQQQSQTPHTKYVSRYITPSLLEMTKKEKKKKKPKVKNINVKPTNVFLCLCLHHEVNNLPLPTSLNTYTLIDAVCSSDALELNAQIGF